MRAIVPLLLASLLLPACTAPARAPVVRVPLADDDLRRLPLYNGDTGRRVDWSDAAARLANADAVLVGEMHGHEVGLPAAAVLFEDTVLRTDTAPALALEFWERDEQPTIDAYLGGDLDRDAFRADRGSQYPPAHERMLEFAKGRGMPVAAANAPRRFVRLARTEGYDHLRTALTDEERAWLVIPERLDEGPYRDRFFEVMGAMRGHADNTHHGGEDPMVLSFYRAQQVWDATMADSVASLVDDGHTPTFLVIGRFHTDYDGATTTRTRDLLPGRSVLTVTFADRDLGLLGLHPGDRGIADLVVYTGTSQR
ncbi:MAG: ChaN family lipoprotein [Planctomycetota bacterium]